MEWFLTPSGEAVCGEIACRNGGAGIVDQMNFACDVDLFREWARVACHGHFEGNAVHKYNVGMVFKRAQGWGNITRIEGLHACLRECGGCVVEENLSRPGTPRRDWKSTLLSDGYLVTRHPELAMAREMAVAAATSIQLYAS
jgi:hypothetical protein